MRVERTRQAAAVDPSASPAESASALLTQLFPHQKLSEAEQRDALQHLQRRETTRC